MRINTIIDKKANVTLDASELVWLSNVMYFYERHHTADPDASQPGHTFNEVYQQVVTARDMCQYGHLDGHTLGDIAAHELAVRPNGDLAHRLQKLRLTPMGNAGETDGTT